MTDRHRTTSYCKPRISEKNSNCNTTKMITSDQDQQPSTEHSGLKMALPGTLYQVKLLTLFLCRATKKNYTFTVGSEWDKAEKFDDVVFKYQENGRCVYRFLQAKHKDTSRASKLITENNLFKETDGEFSVQKYFTSYRNIKRNTAFAGDDVDLLDFVISTNIDIDPKIEKLFVETDCGDAILNTPGNNSRCLQFNDEGRVKLLELLSGTSEYIQIAEALSKCVTRNSDIDLNHEKFRSHRSFLLTEVIDVDKKKFRDNFFDNESLEKMRNTFLEYLEICGDIGLKRMENFTKLTAFLNKTPASFSSSYLQAKFPKFLSKLSTKQVRDLQASKLLIDDDFKTQKIRNSTIVPSPEVCTELASLLAKNVQYNEPISVKNHLFNNNFDFLVTHVIDVKLGKFRDKLFDDKELEAFRNTFFDSLQLSGTNDITKLIKCVVINNTEFTSNFIKKQLSEFNELDNIQTLEAGLKIRCKTKNVCNDYDVCALCEDVTEKEIDEFIKSFVLAVRQPDEDALSTIIANELSINAVNNEFLYNDLFLKILDWFKSTKNCFLTDSQFNEILLGVKSKFGLLIENNCSLKYKFTHKAVNKINWSRHKERIVNIRNSCDTFLTSLKVNQLLENKDVHNIRGVHIFLKINAIMLLPSEYEEKLRCGKINFLIIDCDHCDVDCFDKLKTWLIKILEMNIETQIILITQKSVQRIEFTKYGYTEIHDDENDFFCLVEESQKALLQQSVTFFGECIPLNELIERDLQSAVSQGIFLKFLRNEEVVIGKPHENLGDVSSYYIEQKITRYTGIDNSILDDCNNFYFVNDFQRYQPNFDFTKDATVELNLVTSKTDNYEERIEKQLENCDARKDIILVSRYRKHFKYLCSRNCNIHWIKDDSGSLMWVETKGKLHKLRKYLTGKLGTTHQINTINDFIDKTVVISGNAGLGKSTLLTHLLRSRNNNVWCQKINLVDYSETKFKSWKNIVSEAQAQDFLHDAFHINNCSFARKIFQYRYNKGELILLIDGYDEISPGYVPQVIGLLKILETKVKKLVVTTRPYTCQRDLDTALNVVPYSLESFTLNNEKDFLRHYWLKNVKSVDDKKFTIFIDELFKGFSRTTNDSALEFMKVPLHIKMVAEVFETEFANYYDSNVTQPSAETKRNVSNLNLVVLYEHFIKAKFYGKVKCELNYALQTKFNRSYEDCLKKYMCLSLMELYSKETLREMLLNRADKIFGVHERFKDDNDEAGIIDGNKRFNHRTYAEYFAALWFAKKFRHDSVKWFLKKNMFEADHLMVHRFFNFLLVREDCGDVGAKDGVKNQYYLHNLVLSNDETFPISENGDDLKTRDKGGRTPLHLVGYSGCRAMTENLLRALGPERFDVTNIKDDVFNWSALAYSVYTENWQVSTLLLEYEVDSSEIEKDPLLQQKVSKTLHLAASNNMLHLLRKAIEAGVDVNEKSSGTYALHNASMHGHLAIVEYLSSAGADVWCKDDQAKTSVHHAAENGHYEVLKYFLENFKNDSDQDSIMRSAIAGGNVYIVNYLIEDQGYQTDFVDNDGNTLLHVACSKGHHEVAQYLVENGADTELVNKAGLTILHVAALGGNIRIVESVVNRWTSNISEKCDMKNKDGFTPLHIAAAKGHMDIVKYLVSKGTNVNAEIKFGISVLHIAICCERSDVIEYLIANGADVNQGTSKNYTSIHFAVARGNVSIIKYLISRGATLDSLEETGHYLFYRAICNDNLELLEYLIESGVDYNQIIPNTSGTPLHLAAEKGQMEVLRLLLSAGADFDLLDTDGLGVIYRAVYFNRLEIVRHLITCGADCNKVSESTHSRTPLQLATEKGHFKIFTYLISQGHDLNATDGFGYNVLLLAVEFNHVDMVQYLMLIGVDVDQVTTYTGRTALHVAAKNGHLDMLKCLLSHGADLKSIDKSGFNTLHCAVYYNRFDVVEFLISNGAHYNQVIANSRRTCTHIAADKGHLDILKLLVSKGAKLDSLNNPIRRAVYLDNLDLVEYLSTKGVELTKMDYQPLHLAVQNGNLAMVEFLVSKGANLDSFHDDGCHVIHRAVYFNHLDIVRYLVTTGTDPNKLTANTGRTPLHLAAEKGHLDVLKYLISAGAKLNIFDNDGFNILHRAIYFNHLDVVKYLINIKFDYNQVTSNGHTSQQLASVREHADILHLIVSCSS